MVYPIAKLAMLVIVFSACSGQIQADKDHNNNVVELDPKEFDASLSKGAWLLEFYAPWCGYCRRIEQTYKEVATELKISGSGIQVARVDASAHKALGARFGVDGFPTFFHIRNGEVRKYAGERSKEALIDFATKGWLKQEPSFSSWASPLGMLGRFFGIMLDVAVALQGVYEATRTSLGLSHPVALGLVAILTAILGSALGIAMSIIFPERPSAPPQQQQRKQD